MCMHPVGCPCTSRSASLRPCRPCLPLRAHFACCTRKSPLLQRYCAILSEGSSKPVTDNSVGTSLDGHAHVLQRLSRSVQRLGVPERLLKARTPAIQERLHAIFPNGKDTKDIKLSAHAAAEVVDALSSLGSCYLFEEEMEVLLQALLMQALATRSDRCSAGDLVRVLLSTARASHRGPAVEQLAASQALVQHIPNLPPHILGKLLWALAKLDCRPPGLLAQLPAAMAKVAEQSSGYQLLQICWSLAVLEHVDTEAFQTMWKQLHRQQSEIGMSSKAALQYCQVINELRGLSPDHCLEMKHHSLYREYLQIGLQHLRAERRMVSKTQSGVKKAVSSTGWRCESEAVVDVYAVDIAIPELKIAVEVDGPSHFTRTKPKRRLGPSKMKMRHLASAGWTVFPISSDEWDDRHASQEKLDQLREIVVQQAKAKLKGMHE